MYRSESKSSFTDWSDLVIFGVEWSWELQMSLYVSIRLWTNVQNLPSVCQIRGFWVSAGRRRACLDSTTAEEAAGVSAAPMPPACRNEHWHADGKSAKIAVEPSSSFFGDVRSGHIETHLNTCLHVTYVWGGCLKPSSLTQLCPYGLRRQHLHWHLGAAKLEFQVNLGKKITGSWKRSPDIVHSCHNVHSIALRLAGHPRPWPVEQPSLLPAVLADYPGSAEEGPCHMTWELKPAWVREKSLQKKM